MDSACVSAMIQDQNKYLLKDKLVQHYSSSSSFTKGSCEGELFIFLEYCAAFFFFNIDIYPKSITNKRWYLQYLRLLLSLQEGLESSVIFLGVAQHSHMQALTQCRVIVKRGDKWETRWT